MCLCASGVMLLTCSCCFSTVLGPVIRTVSSKLTMKLWPGESSFLTLVRLLSLNRKIVRIRKNICIYCMQNGFYVSLGVVYYCILESVCGIYTFSYLIDMVCTYLDRIKCFICKQ